MKRVRVMLLALTLAFSLAPTFGGALANPVRQGASVVDGAARFQIITPTLIRMEYAADGRLRGPPDLQCRRPRRHAAAVLGAHQRSGLEIRTARLLLRYTRDSSPLGPGNVSVWVGGRTVRPKFGSPPRSDALGGWYRGLDYYPGQAGPVDQIKLHQGLLTRQGWYLLDDSTTALRTADGWVQPRPVHGGAYQDGYFFGYGHRLQDGAEGPRHAHRPAGAAAEVGVRQLVLGVLRRTRSSDYENTAAARVPRESRAAGRAGRRHRLEGAATRGTAGTGTRRCSRTRRPSSTGPSSRACRSR